MGLVLWGDRKFEEVYFNVIFRMSTILAVIETKPGLHRQTQAEMSRAGLRNQPSVESCMFLLRRSSCVINTTVNPAKPATSAQLSG